MAPARRPDRCRGEGCAYGCSTQTQCTRPRCGRRVTVLFAVTGLSRDAGITILGLQRTCERNPAGMGGAGARSLLEADLGANRPLAGGDARRQPSSRTEAQPGGGERRGVEGGRSRFSRRAGHAPLMGPSAGPAVRPGTGLNLAALPTRRKDTAEPMMTRCGRGV